MSDTRLYLDDSGAPRIRRARDATLPTGVRCTCGREVYARNRVAQRDIRRAVRRGVDVKCHRCGG